jgi:hypothetical protein
MSTRRKANDCLVLRFISALSLIQNLTFSRLSTFRKLMLRFAYLYCGAKADKFLDFRQSQI